MKISFLRKSSFDSLGRQEINVSRTFSFLGDRFRGRKSNLNLQISLHKILTEILHQSRLTNKHECKVIASSSKFSKISFKQSVGSGQDIFFKKNISKKK